MVTPPTLKELEPEIPFKLWIVTPISEKGCSRPIYGHRPPDARKRTVVVIPLVLCVSYWRDPRHTWSFRSGNKVPSSLCPHRTEPNRFLLKCKSLNSRHWSFSYVGFKVFYWIQSQVARHERIIIWILPENYYN